jgi:COP9 signalosome complex subunit 7
MDPAYAAALAALEPFLAEALTTKVPSSRFLADLIKRATESPGTFAFTELLQLEAVQSLGASDKPQEFQASLKVLELFSWGTYAEYKSKTPTVSGSATS